ncbi:MAG: hypothetical protein EXS28_01640 [Pedosphaera sp.]|nr:hypothetical protein [Pedosphaera sp.]
MQRHLLHFALTSLLALLVLPAWAAPVINPDPKRFAKEIAAFDAQDKAQPPRKGGIVFTGSSSIRLWDLKASFPNAGALNRGFGGSQISDVNHFLEETVLRYEPAQVVFFCGANDLWANKPVEQVLEDYRSFTRRLFDRLPKTQLIVLGVKPSPARLRIIETERKMNTLLRAEAKKDARVIFLGETFDVMLDASGQPREELYVKDRLHLSPAGYALWNKLLAPHLKSEKP